MTDDEQSYTIEEAARMLKVSKDTIRRRIRAGEIAPLFTSIFDASENSTFDSLQGLATVAKVRPQGTEPVQALNTFDAPTSTGNI